MDRYIRDEVLKVNSLSNRQYAYQLGKSTVSALNDLNKLVSKSIEDKEMAIAAFLDIEGVFNNVTTSSLINAISRRGTPTVICRWIEANLVNRIIESNLDQATVNARAGGGCPQGGVLSPLLWSTLVDDLLIDLQTMLRKHMWSTSLNQQHCQV